MGVRWITLIKKIGQDSNVTDGSAGINRCHDSIESTGSFCRFDVETI